MIKRAVQKVSCHLLRARAIMLTLAIAMLWCSIPAQAQTGKVTINADGQSLESVLKKSNSRPTTASSTAATL